VINPSLKNVGLHQLTIELVDDGVMSRNNIYRITINVFEPNVTTVEVIPTKGNNT